jgi:hypothetical protein
VKPQAELLWHSDDDAEWDLQELAFARERAGEPPAADAGHPPRAYREVMLALREPGLPDLPAEFSAQMGRLLVAAHPTTQAADAGFERSLPWLTALLFGGACAWSLGIDRNELRTTLAALQSFGDAAGWMAVLGLSLLAARLPLPAALRSRLVH